MKNKLDEKLIIKIMLSITVALCVFIVTFQLIERNMITIPEKMVIINNSEITLPESFKDKMETGIFTVNINTAGKDELEAIPGIGEVTAQRIIDYRNKNGKFTDIEELLNIERIGEKTLAKIKPYICL